MVFGYQVQSLKGVNVDHAAFYLFIELQDFLSCHQIINNNTENLGFTSNVNYSIKTRL
jgi:hypothetical protein